MIYDGKQYRLYYFSWRRNGDSWFEITGKKSNAARAGPLSVVLVSPGAVLIIELTDGYFIRHDVIGDLEAGHGISLTAFHREDDLLLYFINSNHIGRRWSTQFGGKEQTEEWFVDKLRGHHTLFEWFLFHPEVFESKT